MTINFSKTLDLVPHDRLLTKIGATRVDLRVVVWVKNFVLGRSQRGDRGSTVVMVLCYKSKGRWFDPTWCHWNFSLT